MKKISVLLLGLSLILSACGGGDNSSNPSPTPTPLTSISGTVVEDNTPDESLNLVTKPWTGGAGSVIGTVGSQNTQIATGTLKADGSFSLTLPASVDVNHLTPPDFSVATPGYTCTGTPALSDPAVQMALLETEVTAAKQGGITPLTYALQVDSSARSVTSVVQAGLLVYVDRAVTMTGQQSCTGTEDGKPLNATLTVNLNLAKGWNKTSLNMTTLETQTTVTGTMTFKTGDFPTNNWLYTGASSSPVGLSLPGLPLNLR